MRNKILTILVTCILGFVTIPYSAHAQDSESSNSVEAVAIQKKVDEFAAQLTNEEINALARARIQNMLTDNNSQARSAQGNKASLLENSQLVWQKYRSFLWKNITDFPVMITGSIQAVSAILKDRNLTGAVQFTALFIAMLVIGFVAEKLVTRFAVSWRDRITDADERSLTEILKTLSLRFAVELAGLVAFVIAARIAASFFFTNPTDKFLATNFVVLAIVIVRLMAIFLRFMLAPNQPSLRLVSTDNWTARFIFVNFVILSGVVGVGLYLLVLMNNFELSGAEPLRFWVGTYLYVSIVYVTWRARKGLTSIIKGPDEHLTPGLERMAAWWPVFSIIVMLFQFIITQAVRSTGSFDISPGTGVTTLAIIVLLPFLDTMARGVIRHMVPPMQGEGPIAEAAYYEARNSFARISRVVLFALLILVIGLLWGINFQNLAAAGIGAQLAANLLGSIMVLAVGYLIWEAVNLWINRQLAKDMPVVVDGSEGDGEGGGAGKSRLATVLPLIRMALQITIITITVLLALSRLGVNITPLLAGAGVLGLAVGFGAQTLVKDIVSGVFFLLDDAFRVGEYIDIGGTVGTVEKISVRSLQLRHPNGPVHIVPYGEIPLLTNHSRDYVIMKLRFTVPFETDLEKVRKLFKKIGQQMMENPALAESFIEPFKSQGAAEVNDVGIVVRGKFKTKPGAQWAIRKEVYSRVQKAFEENDIDFARKEVRVQIPGLEDNKELNAKQKEAIKLAAGTAASDEDNPDQSKKKEPDPF